ncbi:MAG: histidine kinase [Gemmatimonadota bacterium]
MPERPCMPLTDLSAEPRSRDPDRATGLDRRTVLVILGVFLVEGIFRTGYFHFGERAEGSTRPFLDTLLSETTGSLAVIAVFFAVLLPLCARWRIRRGAFPHVLPPYVVGFVLFSGLKTLIMWGSRSLLWPLAGLGRYDYGDLGYRFLMEGSNDVFGFVILVGAVHAVRGWQEQQRRRLHQAQLEARLHEARLQALQGQLQPHFLFNTLNTISSVMYGDPERADRLLSRLSELLRFSLAAPSRPQVTVEEELQILERYLEIMRTRFDDRLRVSTRVGEGAREALVPSFLLQPLVENAIQHGGDRAGPLSVWVTMETENALLTVRVEDDGVGLEGEPTAAFSRGIGLSNTRERLRLLFGDGADLEVAPRSGGGVVVEATLPVERASS